MEYITLQNTDITVSRICMGGCPLGQHGWGKVDEGALNNAIGEAIDQGVTFFDTADVYGLGKSEEMLGKHLSKRRNQVQIATKFGVKMVQGKTLYDNTPAYIDTAIMGSLKRLQTDYIDLYQVHYRDSSTPMEEVIDALEKWKQKGAIRAYGLSNIHQNDLHELCKHQGRFATMQDEYSLACRKNENDLTDLAHQIQVTPMTWGSLGQGILTGKYNPSSVFGVDDRRSRAIYENFHGEKMQSNMKIVNVLCDIASAHQLTASAVAIRFILDFLQDCVVLVGSKKPSQVIDNVKAMNWHLTSDEMKRLLEVSK